jgi:hypothetical protein
MAASKMMSHVQSPKIFSSIAVPFVLPFSQ